MKKGKLLVVPLVVLSMLIGSATIGFAATGDQPEGKPFQAIWKAISELQDKVVVGFDLWRALEEKVIALGDKVKIIQDEIIGLLTRVTSLENWKTTVEDWMTKINSWQISIQKKTEKMEERIQKLERFQQLQLWGIGGKVIPENIIMELEGTGSGKTDVFSVGDGYYTLNFFVILDDFPSADEGSYEISLYKIGEENPIITHQSKISFNELIELGRWIPPTLEMKELWKKYSGGSPPGTVGGIVGPIFEGPGKFYFEIEVENVDGWFLRVGKGGRG